MQAILKTKTVLAGGTKLLLFVLNVEAGRAYGL
jgi:hypothetical protein